MPNLPLKAASAGYTVALVIPVFNEAAVLPRLVEAIEAYRSVRPEITQVILVDDGSTDDSAILIRSLTGGLPGYFMMQFARNFGHQLAITAGLTVVDTDAAIIMDADLQDPLEVAGEMIDAWQGGLDVVYGQRKGREGEGWLKKWPAAIYYRLFRWMSDVRMPMDTGDFRLLSRSVIDAYNRIGEQQPFVRGLISWLGFNQGAVHYVRPARQIGESKYTAGKMLRLAINGLTSFSDRPLRMLIRFGAFASLFIMLGLAVALGVQIARGFTMSQETWLFGGVLLVGALQLLLLGVLGLYVLRMHDQMKGRPRYVVRDEWRSESS